MLKHEQANTQHECRCAQRDRDQCAIHAIFEIVFHRGITEVDPLGSWSFIEKSGWYFFESAAMKSGTELVSERSTERGSLRKEDHGQVGALLYRLGDTGNCCFGRCNCPDVAVCLLRIDSRFHVRITVILRNPQRYPQGLG